MYGFPHIGQMHGRQLLSLEEALEVRERLLQPLPKIGELGDALLPVSEELVDPLADERATHRWHGPGRSRRRPGPQSMGEYKANVQEEISESKDKKGG